MATLLRFLWIAGLGACSALAYLAAGGIEGWQAFSVGRLFGEEARSFTLGAVLLLASLPVVVLRVGAVREEPA